MIDNLLKPSLTSAAVAAAFGTAAGALFVELTVVVMYLAQACPDFGSGVFVAPYVFPILLLHTWWGALPAVISLVVGMIVYPRVRRYARYASAIGLVVVAVFGVWIASSSVPPQSCELEPFSP